MRSLMLGLAAVTMLTCGQAFAGAEVKGGGNVEVVTPPTVLSTAENPTVRDQRKLPGQILRCWQNGRLVYEAGGFRAAGDKNGAVIAVPRAVEGEPVSVFDLNQGMCILSAH
jgi:S-formylglutathione hydrolase FrmB